MRHRLTVASSIVQPASCGRACPRLGAARVDVIQLPSLTKAPRVLLWSRRLRTDAATGLSLSHKPVRMRHNVHNNLIRKPRGRQ